MRGTGCGGAAADSCGVSEDTLWTLAFTPGEMGALAGFQAD